MRLNAYVMFSGDCEAAFRFYAEALGGTIVAMLPATGTPMEQHVSPEMRDKIMHARLTVGDAVLMGSDCPPDMYDKPAGMNVCLSVDDPAEAERIFNALSPGATITMQIEETFWALRFGMLVDRYGTRWMINCEKPM